MSSLANQTVLVVGGSSGLGFAAAKAAQREGARIILASSNEGRIQAAIARLGGAASHVSGGVIDVKTEAGVNSFFEKHGVVDHVVYTVRSLNNVIHNAYMLTDFEGWRWYYPKRGLVPRLEPRYWPWGLRHSLLGCVRSLQPGIADAKSRTGVLNIAKVAPKYVRQSLTMTGGLSSRRPPPGWSAIASMLGALPALSRALSIDIAPIRVNVITTGLVNNELWDVRILPTNGIFDMR
jgi:NAD(P)-dependent dehydrogenase (short-subunit alcohol dehydrogenase family)